MKNRILIYVAVLVAFTFSCDNYDLDLQENPNFPGVASADPEAIYNSIQLNFEQIHSVLEDQTGEVSRMYNATSSTYLAATLPSVFDGLWNSVYADFMPDVKALEELGSDEELGLNLNIHVGSAKILQAYVLMEMVDVFADVPFSEIGQGLAELSPKVDPGKDVYAAADALLDEAIALLGEPGEVPVFDNFYGGSSVKWITLANTIKLKAAYLQDDVVAFKAIVKDENYIDTEEEDFQYNYGRNRVNPDSRHPRYVNHYETDDGDYLSNYYMWLLRADKLEADDKTEIRDPRLRYYFYRKKNSSIRQPTASFGCVLSTLPDQDKKPSDWNDIDPRLPYCYASTDGYTGRDHLNGSGIPPDGFIRTSYGLYPMAGDFDTNEFKKTQLSGTTGGMGEGIAPLILSSFVDFMRADVALSGGGGDPLALTISGVDKSIAKVRGFEKKVENKMESSVKIRGVTSTVQNVFGMSDSDISDYKDTVTRLYGAAASDADRRDVIIKEYYIAAFGNGLEAFNMYRKTGMPANMEPAVQSNSAGEFPRSMRYANAFVDRNIDVNQKTEDVRVFWDDGTAKVY